MEGVLRAGINDRDEGEGLGQPTGDDQRAALVCQAAKDIPHQPYINAPFIDLPGAGAELMKKLTPHYQSAEKAPSNPDFRQADR